MDTIFNQMGAGDMRAGERERIVESWGNVTFTPASEEVQRPVMPVFYNANTFHAVPLVAQSGVPFLVIAPSEKEAQDVQGILDGMNVDRAQYQVWRLDEMGTDIGSALAQAESRFSQYQPYRVESSRPTWLNDLLTQLEEMGVIPIGDVMPLLLETREYLGIQA